MNTFKERKYYRSCFLSVSQPFPHLHAFSPSPPPLFPLSLWGSWSEAKLNLLEHRYLGGNFNARDDMMITQRLMLAWPLVHATLGMPSGFSLAL